MVAALQDPQPGVWWLRAHNALGVCLRRCLPVGGSIHRRVETPKNFSQSGRGHDTQVWLALVDQRNVDGELTISIEKLAGPIHGIDQPKRVGCHCL